MVCCRYLQVEWDVKKAATCGERVMDKDNFPGCSPRCPQQLNFSDCGVFVLQYVESFFQVSLRATTVRRECVSRFVRLYSRLLLAFCVYGWLVCFRRRSRTTRCRCAA